MGPSLVRVHSFATLVYALLFMCIVVGMHFGLPDTRLWLHLYHSAVAQASTKVQAVVTVLAFLVYVFEAMLSCAATAALIRVVLGKSRDAHTCMFLHMVWYLVNSLVLATWLTTSTPFLTSNNRLPSTFVEGGIPKLCPDAPVHSVTVGDPSPTCVLQNDALVCCGTVETVLFHDQDAAGGIFVTLLLVSNVVTIVAVALAVRLLRRERGFHAVVAQISV